VTVSATASARPRAHHRTTSPARPVTDDRGHFSTNVGIPPGRSAWRYRRPRSGLEKRTGLKKQCCGVVVPMGSHVCPLSRTIFPQPLTINPAKRYALCCRPPSRRLLQLRALRAVCWPLLLLASALWLLAMEAAAGGSRPCEAKQQCCSRSDPAHLRVIAPCPASRAVITKANTCLSSLPCSFASLRRDNPCAARLRGPAAHPARCPGRRPSRVGHRPIGRHPSQHARL
jgi:hypothetical protein